MSKSSIKFNGLTPAEAGKALGRSRDTVLRMIRAKKIEAVDLGVGAPRWFIAEEEIERFIRDRTQKRAA